MERKPVPSGIMKAFQIMWEATAEERCNIPKLQDARVIVVDDPEMETAGESGKAS